MRTTTACILAILLPLGPAAAAPPVRSTVDAPDIRKTCALRTPRLATSGQVRVFRHPGEFQPSDLHHAVYRSVDNCPVPAIVRRNVGR